MITLQAQDLGKWFGRRKVFDRVSFALEERGSLVITGKNGSGKTTLLKILSGLIRPTKGQLLINSGERNLTREDSKNLLWLVMPDLDTRLDKSSYSVLTLFRSF